MKPDKPADLARFESYLAELDAADLLPRVELVWFVDLKTGRQFVWRDGKIEVSPPQVH